MQKKLTAEQNLIKTRVERHVVQLAHTIGQHNFRHYDKLVHAANYIEQAFSELGYKPARQYFDNKGQNFCNIEAEKVGAVHPEKIIIVGAHYDSSNGNVSANDNGRGVAATLELARLLAPFETVCTIRFVAFANEEPLFVKANHMGNYKPAERSQMRKENIVGMLSLETIGHYPEIPSSQKLAHILPKAICPHTNNFIAFIGNVASRIFLEKLQYAFTKALNFSSQAQATPNCLWEINSSDRWSFGQYNYPAVMVTDTAPFNYPPYHKSKDTYDKVDDSRVAVLINGLAEALKLLAEGN